jgi:hypothetical protein
VAKSKLVVNNYKNVIKVGMSDGEECPYSIKEKKN